VNGKWTFVPAIVALVSALPAFGGELTITNAWSRTTPPGVTVGVVYFSLRNGTGRSDRLLKLSTPAATKVEVHRTEVLDGIARMREVAVLHVEAGQTLAFEPGGMHIMLIGLRKPLVAGSAYDLDLLFEVAGPHKVKVAVRSPN
jgi:copper(I)-binding protein